MLLLLIFSGWTWAQTVTVSDPATFCRIEQFSPAMNRPTTATFKKCNSLVEKENSPAKNLEECKQRALTKAAACLKLLPKEKQVGVKGKFTEKFSVSEKSVTFVCEADSSGGNKCP